MGNFFWKLKAFKEFAVVFVSQSVKGKGKGNDKNKDENEQVYKL